MNPLPNEFQEYLAADESIVDVGTGSLARGSTVSEGKICITDRRMLFVSENIGFTDVRYNRISSIRSWPHKRLTTRGLGVRLLVAIGVLLAVLALVVHVFLTPTVFESLLVLIVVGGFTAAEKVRRTGVDINWTSFREAIRDADHTLCYSLIKQRWETEYVYAYQFLMIGTSLLGVVAAVALLVLTGDHLAFMIPFLALGGLAMSDYGIRQIRRLNSLGESWRTEQHVTIQTASGDEATLQLASTEHIDRTLSKTSITITPNQFSNSGPASSDMSQI